MCGPGWILLTGYALANTVYYAVYSCRARLDLDMHFTCRTFLSIPNFQNLRLSCFALLIDLANDQCPEAV